MKRRVLVPLIVLAIASMAGIVGMLLADGWLDTVLLTVAASPLGIGLWRWRVHRVAHASRAVALRST